MGWLGLPELDIPMIDKDHRDIVLFLVQMKNHPDHNLIRERFLEYIDGHFEREEQLMIDSGYPLYRYHKLEHKKIKERTFKQIEANKIDLDEFLKAFIFHVKVFDSIMAEYLNERHYCTDLG